MADRSSSRSVLGLVIASACLAWVIHDVDFTTLARAISDLRWRFVALAIVFDVLSYASQGVRWMLLLRPIGDLSWWRSTQAIYVGLFTSEILPLRAGEIVRAYLVSRWLKTDLSSVVPSILVERLFDGLWIAIGLAATAMVVPLPRDLMKAGDVFGLIVLCVTALFLYAVIRTEREPHRLEQNGQPAPIRAFASVIVRLANGIRRIGLSRNTYIAFAASLALLLGQALAFWCMLWAYGLPLGFWIATAVLIIIHLGTAVPNAPANVGTYQFFCVVGLVLFGVDRSTAAGFSLVVFILLTAPLWLIGFIALAGTGLTWKDLRNVER